MPAKIQAISYYLPEAIVTNEDLAARFPEWTADEIEHQTGIRNRHYSAYNEIASDCAQKAAEQLFVEHNILPQDIDFVLFCAQGSDYHSPTTACLLQHHLGIPKSAGAMDINLGCSGFVYSLAIAKGLVETLHRKNVLLLTGETITKSLHPEDKATLALFGDAGAAALVSHTTEAGHIGDFVLGSDGSGADIMMKRNGGFRNPLHLVWGLDYVNDYDQVANDNCFQMNGLAVFSFSMRQAPQLVKSVLELHNATFDDIDCFIFHQANGFMLEMLRKKMRIPSEKFFVYIAECGNTVSSTIPIALCEALQQGRVKAGDRVLLAAFGVGLSWAGTIITV
ncbi:MAG: ketoacyl-ACP synthase III [Chitinophagales bacterium]|nr:ketoacyl-ACP synthase III [Chitinophagales bacterium]